MSVKRVVFKKREFLCFERWGLMADIMKWLFEILCIGDTITITVKSKGGKSK